MKFKNPAVSQKIKKIFPFVAIIAIAVLSVVLANAYLKSRSTEIEESLSKEANKLRTRVAVPIVDLSPGDVLSADKLAARSLPKEYVNFDAIDPDGIDGFIGKKIIRPIRKGTPLLESYFLLVESIPFSKSIEPGHRAITMPIDEINSFSGMLRAGDRVDLFYIMKHNNVAKGPMGMPREDTELAPLLENVQVQATGQTTVRDITAADRAAQSGFGEQSRNMRSSYSTITISVPAIDAQRAILIQTSARIVAVLRRPDDHADGQKKLYLSDVVKRVAYEAPPATKPPVDFIIGGQFKSGDVIDGAGSGPDPMRGLAALRELMASDRNEE